jgi:hypothetical protein
MAGHAPVPTLLVDQFQSLDPHCRRRPSAQRPPRLPSINGFAPSP